MLCGQEEFKHVLCLLLAFQLLLSLTPDASALMGDEVLQVGSERCLTASVAYTPIIH